MRSVTCVDGRSMLPMSVGFGNPAEGRGDAVSVEGSTRQSTRVVGVARKLWSQPEVDLLL